VNILFLSISTAISDLNNRGIYPDLLRHMAKHGHEVFIVCPFERRTQKSTTFWEYDNVHILGVKTLNITKSNFIEKGLATILIEYQFEKAIRQYLNINKIDLILYTTPPITFNSLIGKIKKRYGGLTYLMLKDIFPQNAVDLGLLSSRGFLHRFFKKKEHQLYEISDIIGCMSPANKSYLLKNNQSIRPERVEICPNAISLVDRKVEIDKVTVFSKFKIPLDVPVLLYGGNLGLAQGVDFLIEVLQSNQNRLDCFFLIVGNGNAFHKIENWFNINKPKNALLISSLPRSEYDILESFCDIGMVFLDKRFTIPNFPSRILSYMECKLPLLIASDEISDVGPISIENNFGLWAKAGDLNAFNSLIDKLIFDKEYRESLGINGFLFLKENYLVETSYKIILSHFKI
jgi:glycosyltransferase involved in cell wall biosynthesis